MNDWNKLTPAMQQQATEIIAELDACECGMVLNDDGSCPRCDDISHWDADDN